MNKQLLFVASCVALAATSMSFAIRGDIMTDFEMVFELDKTQLGWIAGVAFWGFGLSILFGGPLCDFLGMGLLLRLAAACHIGGTILTIFAPGFWVLFTATLLIGIGNGLVEAVCNPLIATIYPDQKTQKLTVFHAWFPGGIVIGGLLCFGFSQMGDFLGWQAKMALLLPPSILYAVMLLGQKFPETERVASGVSTGDMFKAALRPLFLVVLFMMLLTAAAELGTGQWIANIYNDVMASDGGDVPATAGILLLVWGSGLMYVLRQFGSGIVHRISPVGLVAVTAPLTAVGLVICSIASSVPLWFIGSGLVYVGVCFWWPTMLGIASERFPRTGALGLALMGAAGSFSTFFAGPALGYLNENYGPAQALRFWAVLPVVIFVVFTLIFLSDKSKGGYQVERLSREDANG